MTANARPAHGDVVSESEARGGLLRGICWAAVLQSLVFAALFGIGYSLPYWWPAP